MRCETLKLVSQLSIILRRGYFKYVYPHEAYHNLKQNLDWYRIKFPSR
jgi:hypothetical protein